MADQLDVTRKVLYDAFISLAKRKIIRYVPGDVKPYIVYYQPRLPLSYITIGREAYENRKELFVTKIGAMARYIRDDETCSKLLLMEYFGQKEEKPCGICDVCIGTVSYTHLVARWRGNRPGEAGTGRRCRRANGNPVVAGYIVPRAA